MTPETLKILNEADDPAECESPQDFCWHSSMAKVKGLKPKLEGIIGHALELDDQVQDASYFAQLSCRQSQGQANEPRISLDIYFSNFGKLFTIWSSASKDLLIDETIDLVRRTIEAQGFNFVDSSELDEEYSGVHPGFRGFYSGTKKYTWAIRFFSYI